MDARWAYAQQCVIVGHRNIDFHHAINHGNNSRIIDHWRLDMEGADLGLFPLRPARTLCLTWTSVFYGRYRKYAKTAACMLHALETQSVIVADILKNNRTINPSNRPRSGMGVDHYIEHFNRETKLGLNGGGHAFVVHS